MTPQEVNQMLTPREELINLEYLRLAQDSWVSTKMYQQYVEEQTIENYVDRLEDDEVMIRLLNHNQ